MASTKLKTIDELQSEVTESFRKEFPDTEPTVCAFAPGRVNLIGEHLDYNDGFVLPMAIPCGTLVVGAPLPESSESKCFLRTLSKDVGDETTFEFDFNQDLTPVKSPKWANYAIGVVALFYEKIKPNKKLAFRAHIVTSVPVGGGLSSSASIEVAMCTFLEGLYQGNYADDRKLSKLDKAVLCCKAEQTFANVPCGIMDQYTACMGEADHALLIDCRDNTSKSIPINDKEIIVLVTNSNVKHELGSGQFAERVSHCQEAAKILGQKKLRDVSALDKLEKLREKMPPVIYRRAHHVITEMERTQAGAEALSENNYEEFGQLMYQSHKSLRDDYEVSCEELDQLVELASSVDGVFGSRMTGGGFGGCTVTLVKKTAVKKCIETIEKGYKGKASFYEFEPNDGAHLIEMKKI